jgi:hypothetical protein
MTKLPRFRFSLATLLLLVSWSAVVVWINIMPCVVHRDQPTETLELLAAYYGWPWAYALKIILVGIGGERPPISGVDVQWWPWALVGDAVVGILLVATLTWGSGLVVRRVKHVFRRVESPPPAAEGSP